MHTHSYYHYYIYIHTLSLSKQGGKGSRELPGVAAAGGPILKCQASAWPAREKGESQWKDESADLTKYWGDESCFGNFQKD